MKDKMVYVAIFAVSLLVFLFFSHSIPITDPVESNYALTAKEMLNTADWLSPRIYGQAWFDKPVFFYWMVAIAFKIFGFSELAARLVPACFSALSLVLIYGFAARALSPRQGLLAAMILGSFVQFSILAKFIITDMLLFFFTNGALVFFYLGYGKSGPARKWYLLMYPFLAFAVLTKGPVGILLPAAIIFLFLWMEENWRELSSMYLLPGALIFGLLALPWYVAMYYVHGRRFLEVFFGVHNYLRATVPEHPKDNVFYYYIVVFIVGTLPWSGVAIKGLLQGWRTVREKNCPLCKFCLVWSSFFFVFYTLMATKYLTYTFPMLFPVAILAAHFAAEQGAAKLKWWIGLPFTVLMAVFLWLVSRYLAGVMLYAAAAGLGILSVLSLYQLAVQRDVYKGISTVCYATVLAFLLISATVLPSAANLRSGKNIAGHIQQENPGGKIGMYGDYSTSAVFYSDRQIVRVLPNNAVIPPAPQLDWSSKYTMPTQTLQDFMHGRANNVIVIVRLAQERDFLKNAAVFRPELLARNGETAFYALMPER